VKKIFYISLLLICVNSFPMSVVLAGGGWLGPYFNHEEGLGIRDTQASQELYHLRAARSSDTRAFYVLMNKHLQGLKDAALLRTATPKKIALVLCPTNGPGVYRRVELTFGERNNQIEDYSAFKCGKNEVANFAFEQYLQELEQDRKASNE